MSAGGLHSDSAPSIHIMCGSVCSSLSVYLCELLSGLTSDPSPSSRCVLVDAEPLFNILLRLYWQENREWMALLATGPVHESPAIIPRAGNWIKIEFFSVQHKLVFQIWEFKHVFLENLFFMFHKLKVNARQPFLRECDKAFSASFWHFQPFIPRFDVQNRVVFTAVMAVFVGYFPPF